MGGFKKIVIKILGLVIDILLLGISVIKQIVLPGKSGKGNILSSILIFFIALVERLDLFEHGFFKMANVFRQKYVRRTVIIFAGILFILASFECALQIKDTTLDQKAEIVLISFIKDTKEAFNLSTKIINKQHYSVIPIKENICVCSTIISPLKKYLFTHRLQI